MLDVKQATKVFSAGTASEHHALNGLDLHLDEGEFVTIIGSNGWSGYHFSVGAP